MIWKLLYAVDLCSIGYFCISYYLTCYRRGYRFDFWHANLFLICVLPNMLMLPFAKSELNAIVVGRDIGGIIAVLPTIFLITTAGYVAILVGGAFWRMHLGVGLRKSTQRVLDVVPRCAMMFMSSRELLVLATLVCLSLQAIALALYFSSSGFGFDLRGYTFEHPALRPLALIISNSSVLVGSHCLARYTETKEKSLLVCTLLLSAGMLFFGSRANVAAIYLGVAMCYLVRLRTQISLLRLVVISVAIILFVFYLGNVRAGSYSLSEFFGFLVVLLFYGNNFSDLRDFAWVYAAWDHTHWLGKTYLAGMLAMVPRFISEFRDKWSAGVAMDLAVGLDPTVHPGLRPGFFGEAFFNFGWLGVILVGLITGVMLRRIDLDVKAALAGDKPSMTRAFASTMLWLVPSCIAVSGTFTSIYVNAGVYFMGWLTLRTMSLFKGPLLPAAMQVKKSS